MDSCHKREMQKYMSCQQAFMKQETHHKAFEGKKWVLVNQFIVNYCVYSTWPNTTLAIWGSENRVALLSLPLFVPRADIRLETCFLRLSDEECTLPVAGRHRGWRLLLLGRGSLGHWGEWGVSHEKHLSNRSSVPEDPDSPQKKLQMANGFSKVQWFQWLIAFRSIGCLFRSAEFCQQNYSKYHQRGHPWIIILGCLLCFLNFIGQNIHSIMKFLFLQLGAYSGHFPPPI